MEVEVCLTVEDFEAFLRYHEGKRRSPDFWTRYQQWSFWVALAFVCGTWLFARFILIRIASLLVVFFSALLCGLIAGCIVAFGVAMRARRLIPSPEAMREDEHSRWLFSPYRLIISPDALASIGAVEQTIYQWSVIWKIVVTNEHAFLYIHLNAAQIVPRRVFRDERHFEEFLALVQRYQAGPKPTGIIAGLPPESTAITRPNTP